MKLKKPALLTVILSLMSGTLGTESSKADTFGNGANAFTIEFVDVVDAGNAAQNTSNRSHGFAAGDGLGSVPYQYRMGVYEVAQDAITAASANGMSNVTAGAWTGSRPAASMSWYEAAAFVNWLNTSTGHQAAYNLSFAGSWSMTLWTAADAWTAGGTNLYRHKDAFYFLPSEDEWYKAAYYNPAGSNYFLYPTASDSVPTAVLGGTAPGTAVYGQALATGPSSVSSAGGLSPYGTQGQGGNVYEWNESAFDGTNNSSSEARAVRGGYWVSPEGSLRSSFLFDFSPSSENSTVGFRVASVPEPPTAVLVLASSAVWLVWRRLRIAFRRPRRPDCAARDHPASFPAPPTPPRSTLGVLH